MIAVYADPVGNVPLQFEPLHRLEQRFKKRMSLLVAHNPHAERHPFHVAVDHCAAVRELGTMSGGVRPRAAQSHFLTHEENESYRRRRLNTEPCDRSRGLDDYNGARAVIDRALAEIPRIEMGSDENVLMPFARYFANDIGARYTARDIRHLQLHADTFPAFELPSDPFAVFLGYADARDRARAAPPAHSRHGKIPRPSHLIQQPRRSVLVRNSHHLAPVHPSPTGHRPRNGQREFSRHIAPQRFQLDGIAMTDVDDFGFDTPRRRRGSISQGYCMQYFPVRNGELARKRAPFPSETSRMVPGARLTVHTD